MTFKAKGLLDGHFGNLLASELAFALLELVEKSGDRPVQMAAWMSDLEEENDAAGYVIPYDAEGNMDYDNPAYFYIHGVMIGGV